MTTETKRNLRTAIGVAVWVAMLAISQESAANTYTDHYGAARSAKSRGMLSDAI
ncbi:MAG: hypothetical protein VW104_10275 [Halieaceae bacterium]